MKRHSSIFARLVLAVATMALVVFAVRWVHAQGKHVPVHLTTDWSNRHMIFSKPASVIDGLTVQRDPRYLHQLLRKNPGMLVAKQNGTPEEQAAAFESQARATSQNIDAAGNPGHFPDLLRRPGTPRTHHVVAQPDPLRTDWGMSMQVGGTSGVEMFPAKFGFDVTVAAPDCTKDFVVFPTGVAAAAGVVYTHSATFAVANNAANNQAATFTSGADVLKLVANTGASATATGSIAVTSGPTAGDTDTITNPVTGDATTYTWVTGAPAAGDNVRIGGTTAASAQNLEAAINAQSAQCNISPCFGAGVVQNASVSAGAPVGSTVTLTAVAAGAANNFTLARVGARTTVAQLVTGGGSNAGLNFLVGASNNATAVNFAAAVTRNGGSMGVTAPAPGANVVTITALEAGTDPNSIVYGGNVTSLAFAAGTPGAGQSSIIAFNNLYSTQGVAGGFCATDGPSVKWAYNTNSAPTGQTLTSPILSPDGTKVAYVENPTAAAAAILHILLWQAGEGAGIGAPHAVDQTLAGNALWTTCIAGNSCIANLTFSGGTASKDTNSSPYYDYTNDVLYVGDDNGHLHKFTGVFNGAPTEAGAPWPVLVNGTANLSSPVLDITSGHIILGDDTGRVSFVTSAGVLGGAVINLGGAITDAPTIDGTNHRVFVVDGTTAANGSLIETDTSLTSTLATLVLGGNIAGSALHSGDFDNAYLNSSAPTQAGNMYICGKDSTHNDRPAIFKLGFTAAGLLITPITSQPAPLVNMVSASGEACSPVTIIQDTNAVGGAKELVFFSIGNLSNNGGAPNPIPAASPCFADNKGCLISVDTSVVWPPNGTTTFVTATVSLPANNLGATTGIIVDNVAAPGAFAQAASIYFTLTANTAAGAGTGVGLPLCNGRSGVGCAVKLTQVGLQ